MPLCCEAEEDKPELVLQQPDGEVGTEAQDQADDDRRLGVDVAYRNW